jgi:hypothetical protein
VTFQRARETWSATQSVEPKHGTEDLTHNPHRQLDTKRADDSIPGQAPITGLAICDDCGRAMERIGLICLPINGEGDATVGMNLHPGWREQGQRIHVAPCGVRGYPLPGRLRTHLWQKDQDENAGRRTTTYGTHRGKVGQCLQGSKRHQYS